MPRKRYCKTRAMFLILFRMWSSWEISCTYRIVTLIIVDWSWSLISSFTSIIGGVTFLWTLMSVCWLVGRLIHRSVCLDKSREVYFPNLLFYPWAYNTLLVAVLLLPKILHGTVFFFVCLIKTCLYTGPGLNATAKEFVPSDLKGISTKLYPLDFYKHYKNGWLQADKLINISYSTVNFF